MLPPRQVSMVRPSPLERMAGRVARGLGAAIGISAPSGQPIIELMAQQHKPFLALLNDAGLIGNRVVAAMDAATQQAVLSAASYTDSATSVAQARNGLTAILQATAHLTDPLSVRWRNDVAGMLEWLGILFAQPGAPARQAAIRSHQAATAHPVTNFASAIASR